MEYTAIEQDRTYIVKYTLYCHHRQTLPMIQFKRTILKNAFIILQLTIISTSEPETAEWYRQRGQSQTDRT